MRPAGFIHPYPDFPKPGVVYWDTTPLLSDPAGFRSAVQAFSAHANSNGAQCIAAIEAKGLPLGGAVAFETGLPLVVIRKPGLTPGPCQRIEFDKEYGHGAYEFREAPQCRGRSVYVLYDILAGPGATKAAIDLLEGAGGSVVGAGYVVELAYLDARRSLPAIPILALNCIDVSPSAGMVGAINSG